MAKGLVEKYQQILEGDPGSLVFVELAKALLDRGEPKQAAEVCARGVEHHPESVIGRVLWGKALIGCGKPADAMEQFDQAISIDRENPSAYNLIGEVLLHKGLFRSALPILKRAVALQPTDNRVKQWLDQAQRAVTGQPPAAANPDVTRVDVGGPSDVHAEPTVVDVKAYVPSTPFAGPASLMTPAAAPASPGAAPAGEPSAQGETVRGLTDVFKSLGPQDAATGATASIPPASGDEHVPWLESPSTSPDLEGKTVPVGPPPDQVPIPGPTLASAASDDEEVLPGLTGVFQSLAARAQEAEKALLPGPTTQPETPAASAPAAAPTEPPVPEPSAPPADAPEASLPLEAPGAAAHAPGSEVAPDTGSEAAPEPPARAPGVPPPPPHLTPSEPSIQISADLLGPPPLPPLPPEEPRSRLLPDLPTMPPPPAPISEEMPSVVIAPEAAADIAREYERELREKLLATPPPTFLRRYWLPLSLTIVLALVAVIALFVYKGTRAQNRGSDLITLRSQAFRALALNTPAGYRQSIELAERALALADDPDSQAALAYSNAALYRFFGQEPGRKAAAEKGLPAAREKHPGLALAIPYLVAADPVALEAAKAPLLASTVESLPKGFEGAEVQSLVGRLQLAGGKTEEALTRFKNALDADSSHVATLVALGEYYLAQSEPEQALRWLSLAAQASPEHVPALLGVVSAKLALGGEGNDPGPDLDAAKAAWSAGAGSAAAWPAGLRMDLDLAEGRVLALQGKLADATAKLSSGATEHAERAADFYAALGSIEALTGNYDRAEAAYRKAVDRRRTDTALREELARALIARGKPLEALKVTDGRFPDDRRLRIVRGLARLELGQYAKAKEELTATQRNGKVPAEAAIYLAATDAATGQRELAHKVLENAARTAKGRGAAHVALGRVLLDEGKQEEAIASFTAATADRRDWEGACSLGRLYLRAARFQEARKQLATAVERNKFHVEARLALGQALLALGEAKAAQAEFETALAQAPSAAAHRGLARAMLAQGDHAGARAHLATASKLDPRDPENGRLAAQLALATGDAQEAIKSLERAAKGAPRDPAAWCELGETLLKVGNAPAAAKAFDTALKHDRGNPRARLGLVAAGLPKQARRVSKDANLLVSELKGHPELKARALALASRVHLALGDKANAAALAKRAVEADDASADAHLALALVASASKDDETAMRELSRVVAADPAIAEAHLALAVSLARDPTALARSVAELEAYLRIAPTGPDAPTAKKILQALQRKLEK